MPAANIDGLLDILEQADALDELSERLASRSKRNTTVPKWTDRLANTLRQIRLEQLASQGGHVVADQSER